MRLYPLSTIGYFLLQITGVLGQCANRVLRPEIRELSPDQLRRFINATLALQSPTNSFYREQTQLHLRFSSESHGTPAFLPWHREYIRRYELALQEVDPTIILPYWDWSMDSQAPERSRVLSNAYFGGNGGSDEGCIEDGPFANWELSVPNRHCLRRDYDSGDRVSSFYAPEALEVLLAKSMNYKQFRERIEAAPHARVHASLGGKRGDIMTMHSPNDPLFFLHHAFIDLLWDEWQLRHPDMRRNYEEEDADGDPVSLRDRMKAFGMSVGQAFNSGDPRYCYQYPRYNARLPSNNQNQLNRRQGLLGGLGQILGGAMDTVEFTLNALVGKDSLLDGIKLDFGKLKPIGSLDRSTPNMIRSTHPVPEAYLAMNRINVTMARKVESELNMLVAACNARSDFHPRATLLEAR